MTEQFDSAQIEANIGTNGRLAEKKAVVFGAGSGIGLGVVEAFLREGAEVVALELSPEKSSRLSSEYPQLTVVNGNACNPEDLEAVAESCLEQGWDELDIAVNCVGLFDSYRVLEEISSDQIERGFDEIYHVNVLSGLRIAQQFLPNLRKAQGTIIFTASSSAFFPGRGGVLYVSSKFAIRGCVTSLAHELAPDVRVNCVAPGGVFGTDLRSSAALGLGEARIISDDARKKDLETLTPLRISMNKEDIAGSYVFLASEEARGMTGIFLHPDGGMSVRG